MKNFVFISPEFPKTYYHFCDRLKKNGITVLGISSTPYDELSPELKACLTEYYKVNDMNNYEEFIKAMGYFTYKYGKIDWVESNNEHWLTLDARIRKDFNITTGINSDEIINYKKLSTFDEIAEILSWGEKLGINVFFTELGEIESLNSKQLKSGCDIFAASDVYIHFN